MGKEQLKHLIEINYFFDTSSHDTTKKKKLK